MLNSLNNYPGDGNLNNAGQVEDEPLIQEVYEEEPDDYNYRPQLREVDEAEIRNLSAIREEDNVDTRVYKVAALFFVVAIIGGIIGLVMASSAASSADIQRKSNIARTVKTTVSAKLEGFEKFKTDFDRIQGNSYNESSFESLKGYNKYNFMLDISSEVTSEVVLLTGNAGSSALSGLRRYSADTMLLTQLLSNHINETRADSDAIAELQSKNNESVVFAMQVIPAAIYNLATTAPRNQYANGAISILTYRDLIESDTQLAQTFNQMQADSKNGEWWMSQHTYKAKNKKEEAEIGDQVLPNHLIYKTLDRNGNEILLFADELVLVDRSLLFGKSANALERYNQRNAQIKAILNDAKEASASIVADLEKFIVDDK